MTDQKKKFACPRCGVECTLKANLTSHLHNKTLCESKISNISRDDALRIFQRDRKLPSIECKYCDKTVSVKSLKRHLKVCSSTSMQDTQNTNNDIMQKLNTLTEQNNTLSYQNNILTKRLQEVEVKTEKPIKLTINIIGKEKGLPKKKIPGALRIACWDKWIGKKNGTHLCLCCNQQTISTFNFHCGHIIAECNGGGITLDNLRPICVECNLSMSSMNMKEFAKTYFNHAIVV